MALLFCDSFDHYTGSGPATTGKWTNQASSGGGAIFPEAGNGRFVNGLRLQASSTGEAYVQKALGVNAVTLIAGFAVKKPQLATDGDISTQVLAAFMDTGASYQVELRTTSAGAYYFTRNGTSLGVQSADNIYLPNVWIYLEMKVKFDGSTGTVELRKDGNPTPICSGSGLDTTNTANNYANMFRIRTYDASGTGAGSNTYWDDIYVCDGTGAAPNNDFLGDVRVEAIMPNGNGNSSQLVGSDGNSTDNYLLVDETTINDADYVQSATVGEKDTYTYANLVLTAGTVYGVQTVPRAWKSDAGFREFRALRRLSGTEEEAASNTLSTSAAYFPQISETKPGGGVWTIADVNNAEFGAKVQT